MSLTTQQRSQSELIDTAVNRRVWAIVGDVCNPHKPANRIYQVMKQAGYMVYPVCSYGGTLDGDRVFASLSELPVVPDVVDIVVQPHNGRRAAEEAKQLGVDLVWFQPGADSPSVIAYAQSLGLDVIHHACAMVERKHWCD